MERALRFANIAMFAIALQRRRLSSVEPEDEQFVLRWLADLEFMISALRRLRRAAQLAAKATTVRAEVEAAIAEFDAAVPSLPTMWNVAEHIEDYGVDEPRRHLHGVDRGLLEVSTWDGTTSCWLGLELNIDSASHASARLLRALKGTADRQRPDSPAQDHPDPPGRNGRHAS